MYCDAAFGLEIATGAGKTSNRTFGRRAALVVRFG
jgi:hypothetical protein